MKKKNARTLCVKILKLWIMISSRFDSLVYTRVNGECPQDSVGQSHIAAYFLIFVRPRVSTICHPLWNSGILGKLAPKS